MEALKKILKWAAIAFGLVLVLLILLVIFMPPMAFTTQFEVNKPPQAVWAVFGDEEAALEWIPGLVSMETTSGEPMTVGSRHLLVFEEDGERIEMEEEVTSVKVNEEFAFTMTHEFVDTDVVIRLEDLGGDRTRVVIENVVRGKHIFKLIFPLMKSDVLDRQELGNAKLKAIVEAS